MKQLTRICTVAQVARALHISVSPAVSPVSVVQGRQLFEKHWSTRNPTLGGDGLGPLFNAVAPPVTIKAAWAEVVIHGSMRSPSANIESLDINGGRPVTNDVVSRMLRTFHPGFVAADGGMKNTLPLMHHGGTPGFDAARSALLQQVRSQFSDEGGSTDPSEVRFANSTPVLFTHQDKVHQISLCVFQRNTTALFGDGLIEQISAKDIEAMTKLQKQHPEISGRPATLRDGRYGKFGWRGNIASLLDFCDQAGSALGLETRRKTQPRDDMNPDYRNSTFDISDDQIVPCVTLSWPCRHRRGQFQRRRRSAIHRARARKRLHPLDACLSSRRHGTGGRDLLRLLLHDMGYESIGSQ